MHTHKQTNTHYDFITLFETNTHTYIHTQKMRHTKTHKVLSVCNFNLFNSLIYDIYVYYFANKQKRVESICFSVRIFLLPFSPDTELKAPKLNFYQLKMTKKEIKIEKKY